MAKNKYFWFFFSRIHTWVILSKTETKKHRIIFRLVGRRKLVDHLRTTQNTFHVNAGIRKNMLMSSKNVHYNVDETVVGCMFAI